MKNITAGSTTNIKIKFANKLKVEDKNTILRLHHQKIKQLITKARIGKVKKKTGKQLLKELLRNLLEMHACGNVYEGI